VETFRRAEETYPHVSAYGAANAILRIRMIIFIFRNVTSLRWLLQRKTIKKRLQLAWGNRLQPLTDFRVARDGDYFMVPFECDTCMFRKLCSRLPIDTLESDTRLLKAIRRDNLDGHLLLFVVTGTE
jgi:hypothetical protein